MKYRMNLAMFILLLASTALADFDLPKNVYRMDQLEAAKAEAVSKNKAITFVYTQKETTCPLCVNSSLGVMKGLASKSIVFYADTKTDWEKFPTLVQEALRKPEMGKYIPKTVIVNAGITNVIAIVPYALGVEQKKLLKEANRAIVEALEVEKKASRLPSAQQTVLSSDNSVPSDENREMRLWKSKTGFEVNASLLKEGGGTVVLKKENGDKIIVLLNILSEEDQTYITKLREAQ